MGILVEQPLVAAPMAGGVTTTALARAAADAGAFPFLPGGYTAPDVLADAVAELRAAHPLLGLNLFVPSSERMPPAVFAAYGAELAPEFGRFGLTPDPRPRHDDDHWQDKLALVREDPVPVVSFTFGLPPAKDVAALRRRGSTVLITVTTPTEARAAAEVGADGLVVQGPGAGGHSATFDPHRAVPLRPTADVVRAVRSTVALPLVAAGGVDGPTAVQELLRAGAEAVAVGTLLLRTDEAGSSPAQRAALAAATHGRTVLTRAYSGRPARAVRNGFTDRHPHAPVGYPEVNHLTRPLRAAAATAGDLDVVQVWAGTGYRAAREGPAADVVRGLVRRL